MKVVKTEEKVREKLEGSRCRGQYPDGSYRGNLLSFSKASETVIKR